MKKTEFLEKELKMLSHFLNEETILHINSIWQIYSTATYIAFTENRNDKYDDSLRKCLIHLNNGGHRMNEEFDELIQLD